jgi:hypothetical protein
MWQAGIRADTRTPGPPDYEAGVPNSRRRRLATLLMQIYNHTPKQSHKFGNIRYILFSPVSSDRFHVAYRFFPYCKNVWTSTFIYLNYFQCNHLSSDHFMVHQSHNVLSIIKMTVCPFFHERYITLTPKNACISYQTVAPSSHRFSRYFRIISFLITMKFSACAYQPTY